MPTSMHVVHNPHRDTFPTFLSHQQIATSGDTWQGIVTTCLQQQPFEWSGEFTTEFAGIRRQLRGKTRYHMRAGGSPYQAQYVPGSLTIYPNRLPTWSRSTHPVVTQHVYLLPILFDRFVGELHNGDSANTGLTFQFNVHDPFVDALCQALLSEIESPAPFGRLYAESIGCTLALHLLRKYSTRTHAESSSITPLTSRQMQQIHDYLDAHLDQSIGLEALARLVSLSAAQFTRRFKATTGIPPHQYVINHRLEAAKALLLGGITTVTAAAHQVGFSDHSHLIRHFKRRYGVTPSTIVSQQRRERNIHNDG